MSGVRNVTHTAFGSSTPRAFTHRDAPMRRLCRRFVTALLLVAGLTATVTVTAAATVTAEPGHAAAGVQGQVLEVFVREGCPYCAEAKRFLAGFAPERPALTVVYRDVGVDGGALDDLIEIASAAGRQAPVVPTFAIEGREMFGFVDADTSGPALVALVDGHDGDDAPEPAGMSSALRLGMPLFSLAMGALDGINPCAMWALLFLLSMVVHLRDRGRIALLAGSYVAASAAFHFAMLAAWLNVFTLVRMSGTLRLAVGAAGIAIGLLRMKDFFAPGVGPSLSVPASAKPGIGARLRAILAAGSLTAGLAGVAMLALVVNLVELLCTAGLPAVYTAVLARHDPGPAASYGYLGLYMLGYLLPSTVLVSGAVALLSSPHLSAQAGRWLSLTSGLSMLALGASMLLPAGWPWT